MVHQSAGAQPARGRLGSEDQIIETLVGRGPRPESFLELERRVQRLHVAIAQLRAELHAAEADCSSLACAAQAARQARPASLVPLTRQECRVALLAADGATDADIASCLGISVNTAKSHMKEVLHRLGLHSRWELAHIVALTQRVTS